MKNQASSLVALGLLLGVSLSCSFLKDKTSKAVTGASPIDLTAATKGIDVKVDVDKTQTSSGKIGKAGGSLLLTAADGSKFTLDVPADAIQADTEIKMTVVKRIEGTPLENATPTAVQLEPSGLTFKQVATLTILPAKEIPIKDQIIFGYEENGKDYHLAPVDPKSKEIKVKLLGFSGAGVGSGRDSAWAAHLMIDAGAAKTRLLQKLAETTQAERNKILHGRETDTSSVDIFGPFIEAFYDQVLLKEIAAAELDCKNAQQALDDLIFIERLRHLSGGADTEIRSIGYEEKSARLQELGKKCKKSYHAEGSSNGAFFKGDICDLNKPFTIDVDSRTGKWPMNFTPTSEFAGSMEGTFSSNGCTLTGGGPYTISIGENGSGTITFTYNSTATCPMGSTTTSKTSTLPLKPAPELACP